MSEEHRGYLSRPQPSGLPDVEIILNKGLVIDAYVRLSLAGIEVLTIDDRIVDSSVNTYLRFTLCRGHEPPRTCGTRVAAA